MSAPPPRWREVNRRMWDARVPVHVASDFYDVAGFKAGRPSVEPFEVEELGPLGGLKLAHLQCHLGLDTLDLVRLHPTLAAVGLDFSGGAVAAATSLASELGLAGRARFVEGDVTAASSVLGHAE
ncbi:MAG: SAM-dependent methyltransferase, partial [Acidimicrobiales bacterium]|nr:SAM-dependent methyltransferase [Acidimicrobiales bacterium]